MVNKTSKANKLPINKVMLFKSPQSILCSDNTIGMGIKMRETIKILQH